MFYTDRSKWAKTVKYSQYSLIQPAKTSVSPDSSLLGTFRADERLRLSDRNSILMTQINVYIINPVVVGFLSLNVDAIKEGGVVTSLDISVEIPHFNR